MENSTARLLREASVTVQFIGESKTIEALAEARRSPEALRKIDEVNKAIVRAVSTIYRVAIRSIKKPARGTLAVNARTACFVFQEKFLDYRRTDISQHWGVPAPNVSTYISDFNQLRSEDARDKKLLTLFCEAEKIISENAKKILSNG